MIVVFPCTVPATASVLKSLLFHCYDVVVVVAFCFYVILLSILFEVSCLFHVYFFVCTLFFFSFQYWIACWNYYVRRVLFLFPYVDGIFSCIRVSFLVPLNFQSFDQPCHSIEYFLMATSNATNECVEKSRQETPVANHIV